MKYCSRCVMPHTRPGITFNESGLCSACQAYDNRGNVNYEQRFKELEDLCDKYRGMNGPDAYDCMIAVSGGKDSHFQVYTFKERLKMNPLLVTVEDNFPMTKAGIHNLKNISEEFGCDVISMKPNIRAQKAMMLHTFKNFGKPTYFIDRYIYTYPLHMAVKFNTPLLIYGENVGYEYGGNNAAETYSAKDQIKNGVASGLEMEDVLVNGITRKDLNFFNAPSTEELDKLNPIYLSYFVAWNSFQNYNLAKSRGFKDLKHEWRRSHHVEDFDQIDSRAYLVHSWMKYPKFGHGAATDYAARMIRYGLLTREEAINLVRIHDHDLDNRCVDDFCNFMGITHTEFWKTVDGFYDPELFEREKMGNWKLKDAIYDVNNS